MSGAITGETIGGSYIPMPPPSGSPRMTNGQALGSNVAMVYDSNLSVLCRESKRHHSCSLGWPWPYPGKQFVVTALGGQFNGVNDLTPPSIPVATGNQAVPWGDARYSARFGPYQGIPDQNDGNGNFQNRTIKCHIDITTTGSFTYQNIVFAMTNSASGTNLFNNGGIDVETVTVGGTGQQQFTQTLTQFGTWQLTQDNLQPARASSPNPNTSAYGNMSAYDWPFFIWFGLVFVGSGTLTVNGTSIYEVRS